MKSSFIAPAMLCASLLAAPLAHAQQFKVLLFTKSAGWHHDAVHAGVSAVRELGTLHDFEVFWTADAGRVMNAAELAKYRAVVFLPTTGGVLDEQPVWGHLPGGDGARIQGRVSEYGKLADG